VPSTVLHVCSHPTISTVFPTIGKVPSALSPTQSSQPPRDSPICFSLPSEEDVLGFKEDILGFHFTDFPPGLHSSECAGAVSPCAVADLNFHKDAWTTEIRAQLPQQLHLHDSLVHIVARPRVCGILGDGTCVYTITATADRPIHGLCNSGANLCMTNNPNILVDVRPCEPFMILLATTDGGHSHTNVCRSRGLLPLPLLDGTSYYQTCFVNPYASETFISPQAIVDSSAGTFDKWQLEGFSVGAAFIKKLAGSKKKRRKFHVFFLKIGVRGPKQKLGRGADAPPLSANVVDFLLIGNQPPWRLLLVISTSRA
jgi:hypothetical protein